MGQMNLDVNDDAVLPEVVNLGVSCFNRGTIQSGIFARVHSSVPLRCKIVEMPQSTAFDNLLPAEEVIPVTPVSALNSPQGFDFPSQAFGGANGS
jgi:hypothetical protein